MNTNKDYYELLEVESSATIEEIRRAFQKKARTLHPDINKESDAEERFKEVSEAYAVLSDEKKRARYDAMRKGTPFGSTSPHPSASGMPNWEDMFYGAQWSSSGFPFGFDMGNFTNRRQSVSTAYNPHKGFDITISLQLTIDEALKGAHKIISYQRYVPCEDCQGKGSLHDHSVTTCTFCNGSGQMEVDLTDFFGVGARVSTACSECGGSGKVVLDPCASCMGSGRVLKTVSETITIPKKVVDSQKINLEGKGHTGTNGEPAGNLVVTLLVPEARLDQRLNFALSILGFVAPFMVVSAVMHVFVAMFTLFIFPLILGFYFLFQSKLPQKISSLWLKNVAMVFARSFLSAALFVCLLAGILSCSSAALH